MEKYIIIADDFTGSNDTGVQMSKRGIPVDVILFPEESMVLDRSVVLDTESRNIDGASSANKVGQLFDKLTAHNHFDLYYKKIDSTLRGNIKEEVAVIMEKIGAEKLLFAPAFPEIGRTTLDGVHYVNGERLRETEFAQDPIKPLVSDELKDFLPSNQTQHHSLDEVESGSLDLSGAFAHTFDADKFSDLVEIAKAGLALEEKVLWIGSAGLAEAIFYTMQPKPPALGVVASVSAVAFEQLDYAEKELFNIFQIPVEQLMQDAKHHDIADEVAQSLLDGNDTILTPTRTRADLEASIAYGQKLGFTPAETSTRVKDSMGLIVREVLEKVTVSGIYMTGGDTAIAIINQLEASGASILKEVETGVVLSKLSGGQWDQLHVITKAGAFGNKQTLVNSMESFKEAK